MKHAGMLASLLVLSCLGSAEEEKRAQKNAKYVTRADTLPVEDFVHATDAYLEGYIQALVDMHYYEMQVIITVRDHDVYIANLPKNDLIAKSIIAFVQDVPGVKSVQIRDSVSQKEVAIREQYTEQPRVSGVWFPQMTVLFQPLIADPREPMYYVAYRWGDRVIGKSAVAVALGDDFPIYRWHDVFFWKGDLQIGIDAGAWVIFNFHDINKRHSDLCELVNTDYMLGIPLTYATGKWSFRLRPYHISGHLGDEYLVAHSQMIGCRENPSFEAIDFYSSYQANRHVRLYFGPGYVWHSDTTFPLKPLYIGWGTEIRIWGVKLNYHRLYGTPFLAVFIDNWQQRHWECNVNVRGGYELSKLQGIGRKMRLFVDYHHGYSSEGQFFNKKTNYWEVGFSWGF